MIEDFPQAEARLYLEHNMGASITDAEWAEIFEVRVQACTKKLFSCFGALYTFSAVEG